MFATDDEIDEELRRLRPKRCSTCSHSRSLFPGCGAWCRDLAFGSTCRRINKLAFHLLGATTPETIWRYEQKGKGDCPSWEGEA